MSQHPGSPTAPQLGGVVAACLTPFDPYGTIDYSALQRQIDFLVPDADAIAIAAVEAAEYTVLSLEERMELLRQGARMVNGRVPLVLGASSPRLATVADLAELAADENADYIQVLAPHRTWGGEPSKAELLAYFEEVQSVSPLPIVAYHNPRAGADPSIETWVELSELPGVKAIKESSRDISKIGRMIEEVQQPGNAAYLTTMQPLLAALLLGGAGGTMPPPATRVGARLVAAARSGDFEGAATWQRIFNEFPALWSKYGLPPVMKSAMKHFHLDIGDPHPPFRRVSERDHQAIGDFLRAAGVLDGMSPAAATAKALEVDRRQL